MALTLKLPALALGILEQEERRGAIEAQIEHNCGPLRETSKPTTHEEPTYLVDGIVHYCVANMPGGVARTSTFALTNATMPFALALADKGYRTALLDDPHLRDGLNVHRGQLSCRAVAEALGHAYVPPPLALEAA